VEAIRTAFMIISEHRPGRSGGGKDHWFPAAGFDFVGIERGIGNYQVKKSLVVTRQAKYNFKNWGN